MKHALDRVLAATGLVVFSPLLAAITVRIFFETGRPVLFAHQRVGKNGRVFRMYKFRTMVQDAIAIGQAQKLSEDPYGHLPDDPRITRSGRFLRRTSLDELPQLLNVLRGDMSLVGPRPCIEYETENFLPHHFDRFLVPAGITGLWQVTARAHSTFREALDMDVAYARGWSLGLDLRLLVRTPLQILSRKATA
jgi:undecaprenyl-phosphate galactose phosphotransferase